MRPPSHLLAVVLRCIIWKRVQCRDAKWTCRFLWESLAVSLISNPEAVSHAAPPAAPPVPPAALCLDPWLPHAPLHVSELPRGQTGMWGTRREVTGLIRGKPGSRCRVMSELWACACACACVCACVCVCVCVCDTRLLLSNLHVIGTIQIGFILCRC